MTPSSERISIRNKGSLHLAGSRLTGIILLTVLSFICSGCALLEMRKQSNAIGSLRSIEGTVKRAAGKQEQIYVLLFREELSIVRLIYRAAAGSTGSYRLWCPPETYYVAAFIDTNNDGIIQKDEPWSYYGMPTSVDVAEDTAVSLAPLTIFDRSPALDPSVKVELYTNLGKVGTLQDPMFSPENYAMGMWRPADFLNKIGGDAVVPSWCDEVINFKAGFFLAISYLIFSIWV